MVTIIFKAVIFSSGMGSFLTMLFTIIMPMTKKQFGSNWHYYIWLVVLISLVLPVNFDVSAKIPILTDELANVQMNEAIDKTDFQASPSAQTQTFTATAYDFKITDYERSRAIAVAAHIWLGIAGILFSLKIGIYGSFLHRLRYASRTVLCPELAAFTNKKITVRICNNLNSPMLIGMLKPTLLLPNVSQ